MRWGYLLKLATWLLCCAMLFGIEARADGSVSYRVKAGSGSDSHVVEISAGDRRITLNLRRSGAVAGVVRSSDSPDVLHLAGRVAGDDSSWARISVDPTNSWLMGLIRQGDVLLSVETRRSGVIWLDPVAVGRPHMYPVSRLLPMAAVVDSAYDEAFGGFGRQRGIALLNQVDGLFQEQLGLGIELRAVRVITDPSRDPLRQSGGSLEDILLAFRNYRQADPTLPEDVGLVHLFSGAELFDRRVGLAYTAGVCDTNGHDISVSRLRLELLTVAHEIAHGLGAPHLGAASCGPSNSLMSATVRPDVMLQLSSCSVQAIQPSLDRGCFVQQADLLAAGDDSQLDSPFGTVSPRLQAAVAAAEPVSPFVLLLVALVAVGVIRRRGQ